MRLDDYRAEIDTIDKQIIKLLEQRLQTGNALCSFMIILLSECIHLYPKDIFGVWFVCGLK